jgi:hypothetical protein
MLTHHNPAPQSISSRPFRSLILTPEPLVIIVGPFFK